MHKSKTELLQLQSLDNVGILQSPLMFVYILSLLGQCKWCEFTASKEQYWVSFRLIFPGATAKMMDTL